MPADKSISCQFARLQPPYNEIFLQYVWINCSFPIFSLEGIKKFLTAQVEADKRYALQRARALPSKGSHIQTLPLISSEVEDISLNIVNPRTRKHHRIVNAPPQHLILGQER